MNDKERKLVAKCAEKYPVYCGFSWFSNKKIQDDEMAIKDFRKSGTRFG